MATFRQRVKKLQKTVIGNAIELPEEHKFLPEEIQIIRNGHKVTVMT